RRAQPPGKVNQKREPWPSTLSNPISPSCAATISCASASPSPVPPISRISGRPTRKNFSNRCGCWSARMPRPSSLTPPTPPPAPPPPPPPPAPPPNPAERGVLDPVRQKIRAPRRAPPPAPARHQRRPRPRQLQPVRRALPRERPDLLVEQLVEPERPALEPQP